MRILVVASYAPPHIGGIDSIVELEMRLLLERGHEVVLVTSNCGSNGTTAGDETHERCHIYRIAAWNVLEQRADICWPIFISPRLFSVLWRRVQWCDAVHVHGHAYMHGPIALAFAKLFRKRALLSMHDFTTYKSRWKKMGVFMAQQTIGRLSFLFTDAVTTQRKDSIPLLRKLSKKTAGITWLLNPVQSKFFYPPTAQQRAQSRKALGWDENRKKVLFVGYVRAGKGADLLLQAGDPDYDIIFCGGCSAYYHNEIIRHGMAYLPPRPHDGMISLYHAADIVVLPSRAEGHPMAINEAMACGLPVVLTRYRGSEIYNQEAFKGVYFCDFTPESLKEAIQGALAYSGSSGMAPHAQHLTDIFPTEETWVDEITRLMTV